MTLKATCLVWLLAIAGAASQSTGFIAGQVVDAVTGKPVAAAIVSANTLAAPAASRRMRSDGQGRFLLRDFPKGRYLLMAVANGYLDGGFGQRQADGASQPFELAEGQRVGDVTIRLWPEATLSGSVTDERGDPVAAIAVSLSRRDFSPSRGAASRASNGIIATTDDRGMFFFASLSPGDYLVSVPTRMIALPARLAGAGAPTAQALQATGLPSLTPASQGVDQSVRVGDLLVLTSPNGWPGGSNAFFGRLPFRTTADGKFIAYPTTYYRDAIAASDATAISLKPGEERAGIAVQLRPVQMSQVSGTLIGPSGPEADFAVHLIPAHAAGITIERTHETGVAVTDGRGGFLFPAVPPGPYVLRAWRRPQVPLGNQPVPFQPTLWGELPIVVSETPATSLELRLTPGLTIRGKLVFEGSAAVPPPTTIQLLLRNWLEPAWPLAVMNMTSQVAATGEFSTQGFPPGRYFLDEPLRGGIFAAWYFDSLTVGGKLLGPAGLELRDADVRDVVVTFTDRPTALTGVVVDASVRPDPTAAILVFPADHAAWRVGGYSRMFARLEMPDQNGAFTIAGLPPGDYLVVAGAEETLRPWQPPTIDPLVTSAARVTLTRGASARIDVRRRAR